MKSINLKVLFTSRNWESSFPIVVAIGIGLMTYFIQKYVNFGLKQNDINAITSAYVNFAAITMGFQSALLGILFSISNSPLVADLFKSRARHLLKRYFLECLLMGGISLIFSIGMYLLYLFSVSYQTIIVTFFVAFCVYYLLCNFRIIIICMDILFNKDGDKVTREENLDSNKRKELKELSKK